MDVRGKNRPGKLDMPCTNGGNLPSRSGGDDAKSEKKGWFGSQAVRPTLGSNTTQRTQRYSTLAQAAQQPNG